MKAARSNGGGSAKNVYSVLPLMRQWKNGLFSLLKKTVCGREISSDKMLRGLVRACEKRPLFPLETLEEMVLDVERTLRNEGKQEVRSQEWANSSWNG